MKIKAKRSKKRALQGLPKRRVNQTSAPGFIVDGVKREGSTEAGEPRPAGMTDEELTYRKLLQEAILWVTKQVLDEQRADILKRAKDRVKTLRELRGE